MSPKDHVLPRDFLDRLKADIDNTIAAYKKALSLREQKIEHDLEQVGVYLNVLENQKGEIKPGPRVSKKLGKLFSWRPTVEGKALSPRKQQERLEKHLVDIQRALVSLISRRFNH